MKKSLIAVALLGTFAASAFAAPSVTLYGRIDTSLAYTHLNTDKAGVDSTDTFSMESGFSTGNRWGLKGTEDIGNAKVGFVLESGFNSDDGVSGQNSRLFGREAQVNVSGAYGTLYAGRLASIASDSGSIGYLGDVSAFPNAFGIVGTQRGSTGSAYDRYDNTLAYQTPTFGGLEGAIMYSFKGDTKADYGTENKSDADRYLGADLRFRSLLRGPETLARSVVGIEFRVVPGQPPQTPLPRRGEENPAGAHPQRLVAGPAAHRGRAAGELSDPRRHPHPRGADSLHGF